MIRDKDRRYRTREREKGIKDGGRIICVSHGGGKGLLLNRKEIYMVHTQTMVYKVKGGNPVLGQGV